MSEQERIQALLEEGKISQQEADMLLEALAETDDVESGTPRTDASMLHHANSEAGTAVPQDANASAEQGYLRSDSAAQAALDQNARPTSDVNEEQNFPAPPEPPPPPSPPKMNVAEERNTRSANRWIHVDVKAGSVHITADPSINEPSVQTTGRGEVELKRVGQDWEVAFRPKRGHWSGNLLSADVHMDLRIPADYGINLDGKAGMVTIEDVPYLKGSMAAGTLDARKLDGFNLEVKAGTLRLAACLRQGQHHLDMKAGTAHLILASASDVSITGEVKVGTVELKGPFTRQNNFIGSSFRGTVGAGTASLEVSQKAGTFTLEVRDE